MKVDVNEVQNYINSIGSNEGYRYQNVWDALKDNIITTNKVEDLRQSVVEFCKSTIENNISEIGHSNITVDDLKKVSQKSAREMVILKNLNDGILKIEKLLDGLYAKKGKTVNFGEYIVRIKLKEVVQERNINNSKEINDYLSYEPRNIVKFFGDTFEKKMENESDNTRSRLNSFLNYLSPQREKEVKIYASGQKNGGNYKSDIETLEAVNTNDVYKVCRKIIWEIFNKNNLTNSIPEKIKKQMTFRMDEILRATSNVYKNFTEINNPINNPIIEFKNTFASDTFEKLKNNVFELINDDLDLFINEMSADAESANLDADMFAYEIIKDLAAKTDSKSEKLASPINEATTENTKNEKVYWIGDTWPVRYSRKRIYEDVDEFSIDSSLDEDNESVTESTSVDNDQHSVGTTLSDVSYIDNPAKRPLSKAKQGNNNPPAKRTHLSGSPA